MSTLDPIAPDDGLGLKVLAARDYKTELKPVWCPGCGDYGVLNALSKALAETSTAPERLAMIAGIGCSSRLAAYVNAYGFHGVHGRALPVATALALSRPDLTVVAVGGDGDGFSIGGNHFLHACRRNVNFTYLVMDNSVYGMTKGQASPTTDADWTGSKLAPDGTHQPPLEPLDLALAAGAPFIARGFSNAPNELARLITEAMTFEGFAFIQILSPCITYRPEQLTWKKRMGQQFTTTRQRREALLQLDEDDGFTTGVLYRADRPCFQPAQAKPRSIDELARAFEVNPSHD
ncbi:MAG: thiamine pyrophosphate-dependent enzyme [Wenzhouxiangella sp.]